MSKRTVLVVEDDTAIRRGLVDALRYAGYETIECADGTSGRASALGATLDLVLLDVVLPGIDGITLLDELRDSRPTLPVILVTARGSEEDRILGLRTGADDYVVKPFSARELLARVEAVLRRSPERPSPVRALRLGKVEVHIERREAEIAGSERRQISLKECEILRYLAAHRGRAISREELLQHVWGLDPRGLETRTVDMHVARLREKLAVGGNDGGNDDGDDAAAEIIVTVRGKGYMLADAVAVEEQ